MLPLSSFLERIREKPEAVRVRYLFITVGITFLFIVTIWTFSLKTSLATIFESDAPDIIKQTMEERVGNSPVSLEDMMKAGEILREEGADTQHTTSPSNTSNFLSGTEAPTEPPATPTPPAPTNTSPSVTASEIPDK